MKNFLKACLMLILIIGLAANLPANGINLNGFGSKAIAMGGAFVGLANDFSAVYWNPAGLTQMESKNLFLQGVALIPTATYQMDMMMIDTQTESKMYLAPGGGYFVPVNDKLTIGLAAYAPSGLGATWPGADLQNFVQPPTVYEWESYLGVFSVSPVVAYQVSEKFSVGVALNINYGMLKMKRPGVGQYSEDLAGLGFGATLGAMYQAADNLSFGATVKLPTKITLSGDAEMAGAAIANLETTSEAEREATWPLWFGVGAAWNPIEKLTITADVQYTNWKKFDTIPIAYTSEAWEMARMHPQLGQAFENNFELNWEDAVQIRFGLEYFMSESFAIRAGAYTDPTASPDDTLSILLPQFDYTVVAFGFGYKTDKISIDACVEYLMGKDRSSPLTTGAMPGDYGMTILVPSVSVIIFID